VFRKRNNWVKADKAVARWSAARRLNPDRMTILNEVWEREVGHLSRFWSLEGVRQGVLYVKVNSPSAAQELQMRGTTLRKSLNKHFKFSWIKQIRVSRG